jgi:hypothetical protein
MNILNNWKMLDLITRDGESLVCVEGRVYGSNPRFPMTAGAEAPADSHSVYWTATSSAGLKRPVRNAHRWRLWICSDYVRRLSGRLLALCHPVETSAPPQWWRWRESNPRPERFRFAGITTMLTIMGAAASEFNTP